MAPTLWTPGIRIQLGTGQAFDRNSLVLGVDKPSYSTVGCPTEMLPFLDDVTTPTTITTDNEVLDGYNFLHNLTIRADNVKVSRSLVQGPFSTPSDGAALINCWNSDCTNAVIEDVTVKPRFAHWNWDQGVVGHDFTLRRVLIQNTTDGIGIYNKPLWDATGDPYNTNVTIDMSLIEKLAYWTAATTGVVHPSDNATHNDAIQHQGGLGTRIRGSVIRGVYARQYAHWVDTSTATPESSLSEPYTGVALQTLPAGQPWYAGPFQAVANGNTIPDRNSGSEATGRYNVGGVGSLAALMIGDEVGPTYNLIVQNNWLYGGDFCVNGGGNANPGGGVSLGSFTGNRFDHTQGVQQGGGNLTQTLNFQGGGWAGFVTTSGNVYEDNGVAVVVRT